jgi:hypothetical protein
MSEISINNMTTDKLKELLFLVSAELQDREIRDE